MVQQNGAAAAQIQQGHGGHQGGGNRGDPSQAAHHDQTGQQGRSKPDREPGQAEGGLQAGGDRGGLDQVSPRQGGGDAGQAEAGGQKGGAQAVPQVVHGSAPEPPIRAGTLVLDCQQLFAAAGHHAQQGGYPHPEHRPRSTQGEGGGHSGDGASAHGGGQGGGQRLEGGQPARLLPAPLKEGARCGPPPGAAFKQLKQSGAGGVYQSRQQKQPQQPGGPKGVRKPRQKIHRISPL